MAHEDSNEEGLVIRVQTTLYRHDSPELWDRLKKMPPKRRGAALVIAMHRALAFQELARERAGGNWAPHERAASKSNKSLAGRAAVEKPTAITAQPGPVQPEGNDVHVGVAVPLDVASVASVFSARALAAFTAGPPGVS